MLKEDTDKGYWENYLDHIGLFFIFTACAGISIIVWIFNWICWLNNCCCCDFLHNPVNKRIAWWMSFSFLLGILACCVSAFVSANRFGFALEGAWCAVDRVYYDSLYGQLKISEPKWEGFSNFEYISKNLSDFFKFIKEKGKDILLPDILLPRAESWKFEPNSEDDGLYKSTADGAKEIKTDDEGLLVIRYSKIINSIKRLSLIKADEINGFSIDETSFRNIKTTFLEDHFYYYTKTLKACLKILAMIYYSFLLTAITAAGISLMFYACLKRQGYLLTFMHVLWNIIRFFMFSFFLYGTAYGIGFLAIRDSIAYLMYVFGEENLAQDAQTKLIGGGKDFFRKCLIENDNNLKNEFDGRYTTSLSEFFTNYYEIIKNKNIDIWDIQEKIANLNTSLTPNHMQVKDFNFLVETAGKEGGLFGSFDCGFLKSNLNLLYTALYDASVESRILCAVSLCSAFFGAVAVYFFLLVMHHYNNELFFDTGKSIFTGFDGFGGGFKKKNNNQDPAFKKRKLRAEIELTSKNEDNDVKNNEEEED